MSFLGTGAKYHGLDIKCPPQCLGVWSPAAGDILEVSGNFRRWNVEEVDNKEWIL
jgi:hypothetical protein